MIRVQALALLMLTSCASQPPIYTSCPPPHYDPPNRDLNWPEIHFRYPPDPDNPPHIQEIVEGNKHAIVGLPEISNWDFCQTFFENQGIEVIYTNNIIFMRQRR